MTEPFQVLTDFLKQFDPQVSGRSAEPPPSEICEKMKLFAKGDLSREERDRLCAALAVHPEWVKMLVREVKSLRGGTDPDAL